MPLAPVNPATEEEDDSPPVVVRPPKPRIGTTGGVIPEQQSEIDARTGVAWSHDPAVRQTQVRAEIDKRRQAAFQKDNPFTPSSWQPKINTPQTRAEDRDFESQAEGQFQFQQQQVRTAEINRRRAETDARKVANDQLEAQYRSSGQQSFVDSFGQRHPILEEGTNRPLFNKAALGFAPHPKTGLLSKVSRDQYGQRQYARPTLTTPTDPTDDFLYADIGDGTSQPYMKAADAAQSDDISLRRLGLKHLSTQKKAQRMEAVRPAREAAAQVDLEMDTAKSDIELLKSDIADRWKRLGSATPDDNFNKEVETKARQLQALEATVKPGGDLHQKQTQAKLGSQVIAAEIVRDTYADQEEEILARLTQQGVTNPELDKTYLENRARMQQADAAVKNAQAQQERYTALMAARNKQAPPAPVAAPATQVGTVEGTVGSFKRGVKQAGNIVDAATLAAAGGLAEDASQEGARVAQERAEEIAPPTREQFNKFGESGERRYQIALKKYEQREAQREDRLTGADRTVAGVNAQVVPQLAKNIARRLTEIDAIPQTEGKIGYDKAKGLIEALTAVGKHPIDTILGLSAESLPASIPSLAAGAAGSVAGPVGTGAGAGLGSFATEVGSTILGEMQKAGADFSKPETVEKVLANPAAMEIIRRKALRRGVPVAIMDALSAGFAGRILRGPGSKLIQGAAEAGVQGAAGGAGELGGQLASGEKVDWKDVLSEVIGELGTGTAETVTGVARDKIVGVKPTETASATPPTTPPAGQPARPAPPAGPTSDASTRKTPPTTAEFNAETDDFEAALSRPPPGQPVGTAEERAAADAEIAKTPPQNETPPPAGEPAPAAPEVVDAPPAAPAPSLIDQVSAMTGDQFGEWEQKNGGQTGASNKLGISLIGKPDEIAALKKANEAAKSEWKASFNEAKAAGPGEDIAAETKMQKLASKQQFFSEAISAAEGTGSALQDAEVVAAHKATPVDIGPRDATISTGTGVETAKETQMMADWRKQNAAEKAEAPRAELGDQPVKLEVRRGKTGETLQVEMPAKVAEKRVNDHIFTLRKVLACLGGSA